MSRRRQENSMPLSLRPLSLTMTKDEATNSSRRKRSSKSEWTRARKAESGYARQLRKIARHVGEIVGAHDPESPGSAETIASVLERYSSVIEGWAKATGRSMVAEVARRDKAAWEARSSEMGRLLREEIADAPTGRAMREALDRQTALITSLPREAAQRVRDLTREGIIKGTRASEVAAEIMKTGEVTEGRANTIARTETSRTATELTKARAESIGSTHFIWHTAGDSDVRPSHKSLNGKTFRWDQPPECDPGHHALPGGIWNCRCWAEPVIPEGD
ncbi:minor capsid protein [Mesorhizobium sp. BR1-1-16]|uniref:phage head morphogenesis protein n=1 Tax=Mesorhizobium sp. BR1-1-16 TaxID=2876653 RepID=UPI001CCC8814|nr:phage minor head protein [Mesorhizobium sp. BR1-1-16]MBZ9939149.1 minor capsid protein [Mesorhizobium sp. BR1-1-16]